MNRNNDEYLFDQMEPEIDRLEEQSIREHEKELGNYLRIKRGGKYEFHRLQK
jgi:hypothetical protein